MIRNAARRPARHAGFSTAGTIVLVAASIIFGAVATIAVVEGVALSHRNNNHTAGPPSAQAPPSTAEARPTTTTARPTTTQRVTTTTSRAEALAQLLSRVHLSPANGSPRAPINSLVTVQATGAQLKMVQVSVSPAPPVHGGNALAGRLNPAAGVWQSTGTLYPNTTYTVNYVVSGTVGTATGLVAHGSKTFRTAPPAQTVNATVFPTPGISVGIGQPIIFVFTQPIDTYAAQQAVLSHIHIAMSEPVPGGWHWFSSVELHFRPAHYWPTGDGVQVSANLDDWDIGGGAWGAVPWSTSCIIGESRISTVNLATHEMTVSENGKVAYTFPISAGSVKDPTMDGTHIVMDRESEVDMNSASIGIPKGSPGAYNLKVYWDVHISDSGEYVHAAPWSLSAQGFENVSHGCVNLSPTRAILFFRFSRVGDIVQVVGGPRPPVMGDHGVMDWSFGPSAVTWTPATVTQLTTSVTTIPTTTTPPPPGAPT